MTTQRTLSIIGFACAAITGAACTTTTSSDAPAPDAGMDKPAELPRSCKAILDANPAVDSGTYTLGTAAGTPYLAYCDMETDSGGWTLVLKIDGTAKTSQFGYDSPLWTNTMTVKDDKVDTSHVEAKFRSFSEVAFTKLRVVMVDTQSATMMLDAASTSFMTLMRGPFIPIAKLRQDWLSLIPGAAIQPNCNQGGINNFVTDPSFRVRIGLVANLELVCTSPDSFIGVGGGGGVGNPCYPSGPGGAFVPPTAGSISGGKCNTVAAVNHAAFAYVYVR